VVIALDGRAGHDNPKRIRAGEIVKQVTAFYNSWNSASVKLTV
jgi:hypothetical protein